MSEDKKVFNKRLLVIDTTNLGAAINTLDFLKSRWPERVDDIKTLMASLLEIKTLIKEEGHMAYNPKKVEVAVVVSAVELGDELEAKRIATEEAKAKELAEKKAIAIAAKKAKLQAEIDKLENVS